MEEWLEEFLYRGRPPSGLDSGKEPIYHVVIGQQTDSPLEPGQKVRKISDPMSAEAAEAAGWPLSRIIDGMNTEAIAYINELKQKISDLTKAIEGG